MEERSEKASESIEIKDNVGYKWLLNNRLMMINMSFDYQDKNLIRSAIWTTFDMMTPYMNRDKKYRLNKRTNELYNITDTHAFLEEAHAIYVSLLKMMYDRDMLLSEVDVTLG